MKLFVILAKLSSINIHDIYTTIFINAIKMNIKKYVHFVISFFYWYYCLSLGWKSKKLSPNSLWPHGLYSPWNAPGQNTGVGSLSLLQRIFLIWGSNPGLRHCRWILHQLSHKGSPRTLEWVAHPFSGGSSWPRNQSGGNPNCYPTIVSKCPEK